MEINLQPKQADLLDLIEASGPDVPTKIGYGGARGGGKSGALRRAMVLRRFEQAGTVGFIVRRTFTDLAENHIEKFRLEFPEFSQYWRQTDHEYRFPNGSRIAFLYGENTQAIQQISRGPECMDLFIDQAEQFTEQELKMLNICNRWPGAGPGACKTVMFFNPGGAGTEFLRRVFWKREFHKEERSTDFTFIQAYGWDNYEWFRNEVPLEPAEFYALPNDQRFELYINHTSEGRKMNALPPSMRVGELLGSFEHFSGQYYAGVWDENTCILPVGLADSLIQPWWTRWMAQDWGFAHHNANLWFAAGKIAPAAALQLGILTEWPIDVVIVYREYVASQVGEEDLAREVVRLTPEAERKMISAYWLGPDAWSKRGSANTVRDQIAAVLAKSGLPDPQMADNARTSSSDDQIGGWRFLYGGFQRCGWRNGAEPVTQEMAQSGPVLLISAACPQVVSAIPLLIRDEDDLENVLKTETIGDDVADALRYGYKSQLDAKARAPRAVRAQMVYDAAPTPTQKHLAMLRFNDQERKRGLVTRQPRFR